LAAQMFDEIIIRQDKNLRGQTEEDLIALLMEGIKAQDADKKVTIIPSEKEAIKHAIENAKQGSLTVICSDVIPDALKQVLEFKEAEEKELYQFTTEDIPNR